MRIKRFVSAIVISMALGSCMMFSGAVAFSDVDEDAEYAEAVSYVSEVGIMVGDENGNFNPDKTVTRAEMAVILCNMLGETENLTAGGSVFTDVPANHWANRYVVKAAELGLVTGYGDGRFGPADVVTYEQAITMTVSAMNLEEHAVAMGGYPDGYINAAAENGYIDQIFAEKGELLNRGQIAILVYNVIK